MDGLLAGGGAVDLDGRHPLDHEPVAMAAVRAALARARPEALPVPAADVRGDGAARGAARRRGAIACSA